MSFKERYLTEEDQSTPTQSGPMKLDTTLSGDSYISTPQPEQKQTSENIGKPLVQKEIERGSDMLTNQPIKNFDNRNSIPTFNDAAKEQSFVDRMKNRLT